MDLKLLKMRCTDSKQHHVMFHELYSVSLLLCIAQNVRFEIPYKVLYFETPFLIIFKYYAWVSCDQAKSNYKDCSFENRDSFVKGTRLSVLILAKSQASRKFEVLEVTCLVSISIFIE